MGDYLRALRLLIIAFRLKESSCAKESGIGFVMPC